MTSSEVNKDLEIQEQIKVVNNNVYYLEVLQGGMYMQIFDNI